MVFNEKKFELLSFGRTSNTLVDNYTTSSGQPITKKDTVKDLGIMISTNLSFKLQIEETTAKGHRMTGYILRTFMSREKYFMRTSLRSLITPLIEYGSIVWAPYEQNQIEALESIQRSFTSKIRDYRQHNPTLDLYLCIVNYKDRLADLKLYSQQRRYERYLIIHIYKIIIKYLPDCGLYPEKRRNGWWVEPKRAQGISVPNWVKKAKDHSFFVRAPQLYNWLDPELKRPETIACPKKKDVNRFKTKLDLHLGNFEDDPDRGTSNSLLSPFLIRKQQNINTLHP